MACNTVQFSPTVVSDSLWPRRLQHARLPYPSPTLEFTQTHVHRVSDAIQPSHPLLSPSPPVFSLSQDQGLFQWVGAHIRWPKGRSFRLSISPSNEQSKLISFRIDWFDILAVQRTLKSLLQHHSSKTSIFWCQAFFIVQLSHPYMTTGKPELWLDEPLSAKLCLCFLIHCLCFSYWSRCSVVAGL